MEPRNYAANADAVPPDAPATPSNGYPRAADPATGTEATTPGPFWFYKIGEELRAIITAAGITPDDADLNQVLDALTAGFGLAQQLAQPGYQMLPGGLILQWGTESLSFDTVFATSVITFPIAFPTANLNAFFSARNGTPIDAYFCITATDLASVTLAYRASAVTSASVYWMAIGY